MAPPALGQHVDDSAVAIAQDAFGISVGNERTGLYGSDDVRGFSPVDAGNTRIEGLYFDQVDKLSQRILNGSTVRVGISAQHYPFPAPTGIVDYDLINTQGPFAATVNLELAEFGGPRITAEFHAPLVGDQLSIGLGVGGRRQEKPEGGSFDNRSFGIVTHWKASDSASVTLFTSGINIRNDEARPMLFPLGDSLPPQMPQRLTLAQHWAKKAHNIRSAGAIVHAPLGTLDLAAGLFQSQRKTLRTAADLLTGIAADGSVASRTVIIDGNNSDSSTSGEVRLTKTWQQGPISHVITASLRGRDKRRLFGGTQKVPLGPSSVFTPDLRPEPVIALGPENSDQVRQMAYGAGYGLNWKGRGSIEAGLSKIDYRKTVDFADPLRDDVTTRDNPLVWNFSASLILTKRLAFYAGYVTGLEEALIAPDIATNRSEAPPAIRTRQIDAGLRYALTRDISLVAGLFSVRKPYFNLDPAQRYRELGMVESRGLELSLSGQLQPGLSMVLGAVLLDPRISGEAVDSGVIAKRPVASLKRRSIANIDWRPRGGKSPLSFDLAIDSQSAKAANSANTLVAPGFTRFDLGARYRFAIFGQNALLRAQVTNLFDTYGWNVSSAGGFTYADSRTAALQFLIDF